VWSIISIVPAIPNRTNGHARTLDAGERDDNFGAGLIDPLKALQLADPRSATTAPTTRQ
jgi:hypothetical protein